MKQRPIETAPKDGTEILVWTGTAWRTAYFDRVENAFVSTTKTLTKRFPFRSAPTYWIPLPPPPGEEESAPDDARAALDGETADG